MKKMPRHILIRGVNWIGDAVMTIPAMRSLRILFPESRMTLLIREPLDQLFSNFSAVDHVMGFRVRKGGRGLLDRFRLIGELRKQRCDLCVILPNSFDSALMPFLSRIPQRIGFNRDGRGLLLSHKIEPPQKGTSGHQAGDYLSLVSSLGSVQEAAGFELEVEDHAKAWAEERLTPLRSETPGPLIGLNPGAAYGPAKRWFPDRFADLATRLSRKRQAAFVVVGGPDESELCGFISNRIQGPVVNLAGQTDLNQLLAVLSACDLLVTNDSGPMHLASTVGTPVVAIFGSTEPGATSPLGRHKIVQEETDCSPCLKRLCERGDMLCMERVQVHHVYDAVSVLLNEGGPL